MRALFRLHRRTRRNPQSGMALFLAIAMMLLLSILGATVLDLASRDIRATGRVDAKNQVFYSADRIVSFGQHRVDQVLDDLMETTMKGATWTITDPTGGRALEGMESGTITYVGPTDLHILQSSVRTPAKGSVFQVEAIATDNAPVPNRISVDTSYVKILSVLSEDKTITERELKELAGDAAK